MTTLLSLVFVDYAINVFRIVEFRAHGVEGDQLLIIFLMASPGPSLFYFILFFFFYIVANLCGCGNVVDEVTNFLKCIKECNKKKENSWNIFPYCFVLFFFGCLMLVTSSM